MSNIFENDGHFDGFASKNLHNESFSVVSSETVWTHVRRCASACCGKTPHGVSAPVLRTVKDKLYMVFFVVRYSDDKETDRQPKQPSCVILTDMATGRIVRATNWSDMIVGKEPGSKHSAESDISVEWKTACSMLDTVRGEYLNVGTIKTNLYRNYLAYICKISPLAYRRFYLELSD